MKRNMGNADRVVRTVSAITIIAFFVLNVISGIAAYVLLTIAGILLLTSLIGRCPLYTLFGINTRNINQQQKIV